MTWQDVKQVLQFCGGSEERSDAFERKYCEAFGEQTEITTVNMVTPSGFNVSTPGVSIKVDPGHSDLVQTHMIDGKHYILVMADSDVEVNGVKVTLDYSAYGDATEKIKSLGEEVEWILQN